VFVLFEPPPPDGLCDGVQLGGGGLKLAVRSAGGPKPPPMHGRAICKLGLPLGEELGEAYACGVAKLMPASRAEVV